MEQGHVTADLLSAYVDARATDDERREAESHFATCETCAASLDALRRTVNMLRRLPPPPVPRPFALGPQPVRAPVIPFWRRSEMLRAFSGLAAAAMVVLLVADAVTPTIRQAMAPVGLSGLGEPDSSLDRLAPAGSVAPPAEALRQDRAVEPATEPIEAPRAAPAPAATAEARGAERPAGTPAPLGVVTAPQAPAAGLSASEPAPPAPGDTFSASRAAAAPTELVGGRLSEAESPRRENAGGPAVQDEAPTSGRELRQRAADPIPATPPVPWPRVAAIFLGVIALTLFVVSLRLRRSTP